VLPRCGKDQKYSSCIHGSFVEISTNTFTFAVITGRIFYFWPNTATITRCRSECWLSLLPGSGKGRNNLPYVLCRRYDSVGIGTRLRVGRLGNRLTNPDRDKHFFVLRSTQTGNGTRKAFPRCKSAGAISTHCQVTECVELHFHFLPYIYAVWWWIVHTRIHTHKQKFILSIVCSLVVRLTRLWALDASYFEGFPEFARPSNFWVYATWYVTNISKLGAWRNKSRLISKCQPPLGPASVFLVCCPRTQ